MSRLNVDEIADGVDTGAPEFPFGLTSSNNVTIIGTMTATDIVESSSVRYKENVFKIDSGLDVIMKLDGVTYNRKDSGKFEAGLIAEDVLNVLPHLVHRNENGDVEGIHYTKITAYLIEAVKTLKEEIEELKRK